MLVFQMD